MNNRVYVENLAPTASEKELTDLFGAYGNVTGVSIVVDPASQTPRGFGFVTMATPEGAQEAIRALNGKVLESGALHVSEGWANEDLARPRSRRTSPRRATSSHF